MTKSELVKLLHNRQQHLLLKDINSIVDLVFEEITQGLVKGKRVEFRRFGAFLTRQHQPRIARNPSTGQTLHIGAKRVPGFRMGKNLKHNLNVKSNWKRRA